MVITLKGNARTKSDNTAKLRTASLVPAVVYGKGKETSSITVPAREFSKVWSEVGESGTVTLELESGKETVLIHEVVLDPIRNTPSHVDFLVIDVNKPIEVSVPIEFVGTAPAVKNGLGVLVKVMHEIEVKGLPKDLPHNIEVDLVSLENLESHISVANLSLPNGVTATAEGEEVVASIAPIQEEKEPVAGIDFASIEVEKKGKKEEEAESAE